jgi:hypothetical protein
VVEDGPGRVWIDAVISSSLISAIPGAPLKSTLCSGAVMNAVRKMSDVVDP